MKTSELMLGDYLYVLPSNMVIKVAAIHRGKVGYHARTDKLAWIRVDLLRPIPITPEILTKNGFVWNNDYDTYSQFTWADGEALYVIIIDIRFYKEPICGVETLLQCEVNFKGGVDKIHICHIISVHELQHALTICGIDKKIEI